MNPFEQQFLLINTFLNKGELSPHYLFIGMNDAIFHSVYPMPIFIFWSVITKKAWLSQF